MTARRTVCLALIETLCGLVLLLAVFLLGFKTGAAGIQSRWDAANAAQTQHAAQVQTKQADATVQVVTQYVDRVRTVRVAGETILKEVPVHVPLDTPALPGGWRVLHDAAARAELPDPAASADAAPVPAQDAAATVAGNYLACIEQAEQLTALQDWVTSQIEAAR